MSTNQKESAEKKSSFNLFESWTAGKKDRVFNNDSNEEKPEEEESPEVPTESGKKTDDGWLGIVDNFLRVLGGSDEDEKHTASVQALVEKARTFQATQSENKNSLHQSPQETIEEIQKELGAVFSQISNSFGETIDMKLLHPVSFYYYLEKDESVKTPSWKRRKHRFMPEVENLIPELHVLHNNLYLAEASYLDSVDDIAEALSSFTGTTNPNYELVYCSTEAEPRQPAHFIALNKNPPKKTGPLPWQKSNDLEVLFVVRGTKDLEDVLSDCLLESREFNGGYAHDGVCQSGLFLVEKHTTFLEHLLSESGRATIKLSLVGHSLGAGAAAIACIEFNKNSKIEATCLGFGCPALINLDLSKQWEDKITTVVCDADCVARMSKSTVSNLMFDIMANDWTSQAEDDVNELVNVVQSKMSLPADIVKEAITWVSEFLNKEMKSDIEKVPKERADVQLFPPGKCLHLFRDGVGVSIRYVPNDFFSEFDVCRTMVDDHLVPTGYNKLLHELVRQVTHSRFFFQNDVNALRIEKDRTETEQSTG